MTTVAVDWGEIATCLRCGNQFERVYGSAGKFCSRTCYAYRKTRKETDFERVRWPRGVTCPWCDSQRVMLLNHGERTRRTRARLWKCLGCREQFTATTQTFLAHSHLTHEQLLMCWKAAQEGGRNIRRTALLLGITYRSAWTTITRMRQSGLRTLTQEEIRSWRLARRKHRELGRLLRVHSRSQNVESTPDRTSQL